MDRLSEVLTEFADAKVSDAFAIAIPLAATAIGREDVQIFCASFAAHLAAMLRVQPLRRGRPRKGVQPPDVNITKSNADHRRDNLRRIRRLRLDVPTGPEAPISQDRGDASKICPVGCRTTVADTNATAVVRRLGKWKPGVKS